MAEILIGITTFTGVVMLLVAALLIARKWLVAGGQVKLFLNDDTSAPLSIEPGRTLLDTLASRDIYLPAGCGGRGLCGTCKVCVREGGGSPLPSELSLTTLSERRRGIRLACQVKVKSDMTIELPAEHLNARKWQCQVLSNRSVATFIKEVVLELPDGESLPFRAGGYVLVQCPPHELHYADFDIDPRFQEPWNELGLWEYSSYVKEDTERAYSLANYPLEQGILMLNVRIEPPPPSHPKAPPGIVSSYLFSLKAGAPLTVSGPFGEFFARESDAEMVFIGGGAGMAPMRSHIFDQLERLHSRRRISFWYGARSLQEAFYVEDFDRLASEHENFQWTLALSDPQPEDDWQGAYGFIHEVVRDRYLAHHSAPEDIEYYLCGPPPMIDACVAMLTDLGVEPDNILFDKFG
ncbi:NADH:ubiquinone reductase (Na(+)-transporting) subunit F [Halomonas organivorans]